jgi:hypothetical protein
MRGHRSAPFLMATTFPESAVSMADGALFALNVTECRGSTSGTRRCPIFCIPGLALWPSRSSLPWARGSYKGAQDRDRCSLKFRPCFRSHWIPTLTTSTLTDWRPPTPPAAPAPRQPWDQLDLSCSSRRELSEVLRSEGLSDLHAVRVMTSFFSGILYGTRATLGRQNSWVGAVQLTDANVSDQAASFIGPIEQEHA